MSGPNFPVTSIGEHAFKRLVQLEGRDWCNARYHPKFLTGVPYWFFCRKPQGHGGEHDCEAAHEATNRL